jgi:hypothetical protein
LIAAVLGAAWVHGAAMGWGTWGEVASDTGRDLELARLMAGGARLYADVAYYYGPLAPHVNALLVRCFGAQLDVFVIAGLAAVALAVWGLVAIVRPLAGSLAAAVVGLAYLYCCAFAHLHYANVFNWVLPYLAASTYGMLLAIWSVERLCRHVRSGRPRDLYAAVLLLAAAALTKVEAATAAFSAHAVFAGAALGGIVAAAPAAWLAYVAAAASVGAGYAMALRADPVGLVRASFVDVATHPSMRGFLALHGGLADVPAGLWTMAESAIALAASIGIALGAAALVERTRVSAVAAAVLGGVIVATIYAALDPAVSFAVLPAVAIAGVGMVGMSMRARPAERAARLPELILWAAALGCLVRMPLAAGALHYGFYLLPLPLAAFVVWWFRTLPAWLGTSAKGAPVHAGVGAALLVAVAARHLLVSAPLIAAHTVRVDAPRGRMWLLESIGGYPLGAAYAKTIEHLATYPPSTRVLVVPTGSAMPFLAGLSSAGDRTGFVPPEMSTEAEDRLLATLEAEPPDLVVSLRLDLREWGSRGFGVDYARRTWAWVRAHYEPVATFGPEALVLVLRRRE